ncbi:hypothetical protein QBE52_07880 [Clostridiaceae bacterium 35-E11]
MVKANKNARKALQSFKEEIGKELSISPANKTTSTPQTKKVNDSNDVYTHLGRS